MDKFRRAISHTVLSTQVQPDHSSYALSRIFPGSIYVSSQSTHCTKLSLCNTQIYLWYRVGSSEFVLEGDSIVGGGGDVQDATHGSICLVHMVLYAERWLAVYVGGGGGV